MHTVEHAVILAAGLGSRLNLNTPKCLVSVNNKMIIENQLEALKKIKTIFMVVGYKAQEVMDIVSKIRKDVIFIYNPQYDNGNILDSFKLGVQHLDKSFLLLDGDLFFNKQNSINNFIESANNSSQDIVLATQEYNENYSSDGNPVYLDYNKETQLCYQLSFNKKSALEYLGITLFKKPVEKPISEQCKYIFEYLNTKQPISYLQVADVFEVDTPMDLQRVEALH